MLGCKYQWTGSETSDVGQMVNAFNTAITAKADGIAVAVAIARAVSSDAKVLLLDEPLAAMGTREGAQILDLIRSLKDKDVSVIMIGHNYVEVLEVCDRINLLQRGEITFDKPVTPTLLEEINEVVMSEYRSSKMSPEQTV